MCDFNLGLNLRLDSPDNNKIVNGRRLNSLYNLESKNGYSMDIRAKLSLWLFNIKLLSITRLRKGFTIYLQLNNNKIVNGFTI